MDTQTESRRLPAIGGAAIGAMLAIAMLPWSFVVGIGGLWQQPKHDFYAYLTAWNLYALQNGNPDAMWAAAAAKLRRSLRCVDLGWGLICSRHPLPQ